VLAFSCVQAFLCISYSENVFACKRPYLQACVAATMREFMCACVQASVGVRSRMYSWKSDCVHPGVCKQVRALNRAGLEACVPASVRCQSACKRSCL
jgi:hypothetical protein